MSLLVPSAQPRLKMPPPPPPSRCKFFSLTETPEDYTLMVDEEGFKGWGLGWGRLLCSPLCGILTRCWNPESQDLGANSTPATYWLCALEQVTSSL